jgi:hypothetical protein
MKSFREWLELNEAGFFSNLFGKKSVPNPTDPASGPRFDQPPPKKGMSVDDFQRLFDGPNANQEPARHHEPAPQIRQPQMAPPKTTSNPVAYLEEVANKYWKDKGELNELWDYWQKSRQENDKYRRGRHLYNILRNLSFSKQIDDRIKDSLLKILEDECQWEAFPEEDEAEVVHKDRFHAIDGKGIVPGEVVKIVVKGFKRRSEMMVPAYVEKIIK